MSRAVMQQALDVLQKGDVLCEFVACKILSAELAKPEPTTDQSAFEDMQADILKARVLMLRWCNHELSLKELKQLERETLTFLGEAMP
jgi:hypothetical protein